LQIKSIKASHSSATKAAVAVYWADKLIVKWPQAHLDNQVKKLILLADLQEKITEMIKPL
jgi:hypothetical protein